MESSTAGEVVLPGPWSCSHPQGKARWHLQVCPQGKNTYVTQFPITGVCSENLTSCDRQGTKRRKLIIRSMLGSTPPTSLLKSIFEGAQVYLCRMNPESSMVKGGLKPTLKKDAWHLRGSDTRTRKPSGTGSSDKKLQASFR